MRRYNVWGGNPKGTPENQRNCQAQTFRGVLSYQCSRKRGHGPGGNLCAQHAKKLADGSKPSIPEDKLEVMDSEAAREFSRGLTLYETRLRVRLPCGTTLYGKVVEMGLALNWNKETGEQAEPHETVTLEGVPIPFSLRVCEVAKLKPTTA